MPRFLVEGERTAREQRARAVAEELTQTRACVRFEHSIHVPEDGLCFYVFEAPSSTDAARAAQLAGLDVIRIVEAVPSRKEEK